MEQKYSKEKLQPTAAFQQFISDHAKQYSTEEELYFRRSVFMNNYEQILEHNARYEAGQVSWWKKVNPDMDLTQQEFEQKRLVQFPTNSSSAPHSNHLDARILAKLVQLDDDIPEEFDWVSQGKVTHAKDQNQCGSCAAFAALGAVESCFKIAEEDGDYNYDLSEQHILDCAYGHTYIDEDGQPWSAFGCMGAWPQAYFDYLNKVGQLTQKEAGYPYMSGSTNMVYDCNPIDNNYNKRAHVTGQHNVWFPAEEDMKKMVLINPVATAVRATWNWSSYGGGLLEDYLCCDAAFDEYCVNRMTHEVLVVGYGHDEDEGLDYWLIKNSWGRNWGENGFVRLKRGTGHCGVGSHHQNIPVCAMLE